MSRIDALQRQVSTLQKQVLALFKSIKALEGGLKETDSNVKEVINRVAELEGVVSAQSAIVLSHSERLAELENEVNDEGLPTPGLAQIIIDTETEGEPGMADKFEFHPKVEQPEYDPATGDIEKSIMTLVLDADGSEQVAESGKPVKDEADGKWYSEAPAKSFKGEQGATGVLKTVNFDDGDPPNESSAFEEAVTIRDTNAPNMAGRVTMIVDSETEGE